MLAESTTGGGMPLIGGNLAGISAADRYAKRKDCTRSCEDIRKVQGQRRIMRPNL